MRKFWWDLSLGILASVVVSLAAKAGDRWGAVSDKYGPIVPVVFLAIFAVVVGYMLRQMAVYLAAPRERGERPDVGDLVWAGVYGAGALGALGALYAWWFDALRTAWVLLGAGSTPMVLVSLIVRGTKE